MRRVPESVLVVSLGGLGDFLSRWGLWQSLRRAFAHARITCLGRPAHGRLLLAAGLCDEVLDFNDARWAVPREPSERYGLAVSLLGARGRDWMNVLRGAGAAEVAEIEPFPPAGARIPVWRFIESQFRARGLPAPGPLRVKIPEAAAEAADDFLRAHGLRGRRIVALHAGSGSRGKNWPPARFAAVAERLLVSGAAVIAVEGEAEEKAPAWSADVARARSLDLATLAALLARCSRYAGNDCGVAHLAALAGTPVTVIFGPTDHVQWAPPGEKVAVVRSGAPCSPCSWAERERCVERRCLVGIGVEEVLKTATVFHHEAREEHEAWNA